MHLAPGRVGATLSPVHDANEANVARCRIDRHELPAHFRSYTQAQLNSAYASKPLTREDFAARLTQQAGVPVRVLEVGEAKLGSSLAYWALSQSSEQKGSTTAHYMSKTYLSQTPGFAWNVQCLTAATTGAAEAATLFRSSTSTFEPFLASVRPHALK
ncbi:MAG: hypothetical protein CFE43_18835 [Burkholderiales bacterium PBB3]|nr:MAG: hypothetical protein CFE43_18835 [Burkholderiales bacterium PBB3]